MKQMLLLIGALILFASSLLAAEGNDSLKSPSQSESAPPGTEWHMDTSRAFTTWDECKFEIRLKPKEGETGIYFIEAENYPDAEIRVVGGSGEPRIKKLELKSDLHPARQSRSKWEKHDTVLNASGNLRDWFGELSAGEYTVQLRIPVEAFKLTVVEGWEPQDLVSPAFPFTVRKVELNDIINRPDSQLGEVRLEIDPPASPQIDNESRTGRIVNNSRKSISFDAWTYDDSANDLLHVPISWERFVPGAGWFDCNMRYCGTGLEKIVLEPKQSRRISLLRIPDQGVFRFVVHYYKTKEGKGFQKMAHSVPILFDGAK